MESKETQGFTKLLLNRSIAIGEKMKDIARGIGLSEDECHDMHMLGLMHDFGYDFCDDAKDHARAGAEVLRTVRYFHCDEIEHHGDPDSDYNSVYLEILNIADLTTDDFGNNVSCSERLAELAEKYGTDSEVYDKARRLAAKPLEFVVR